MAKSTAGSEKYQRKMTEFKAAKFFGESLDGPTNERHCRSLDNAAQSLVNSVKLHRKCSFAWEIFACPIELSWYDIADYLVCFVRIVRLAAAEGHFYASICDEDAEMSRYQAMRANMPPIDYLYEVLKVEEEQESDTMDQLT